MQQELDTNVQQNIELQRALAAIQRSRDDAAQVELHEAANRSHIEINGHILQDLERAVVRFQTLLVAKMAAERQTQVSLLCSFCKPSPCSIAADFVPTSFHVNHGRRSEIICSHYFRKRPGASPSAEIKIGAEVVGGWGTEEIQTDRSRGGTETETEVSKSDINARSLQKKLKY